MAGWNEYEKYGLGQLYEMGYDGANLDDDYFVFNNNQIKIVKENNLKEEFENNKPKEMVNVGNKMISLDYINQIWNQLNTKYTNNDFYKTIYNSANVNKKLTPKQWWYLDFLFKNGKTPYEAGVLPKNI